MKRFKCTVTREDEYIIEIDENIINQEFMDEFNQDFYELDSLEKHAENIAQLRVRLGGHFIEGYGVPLVNGEDPRWTNKNGDSLERGINIRIISEDQDCEVEAEEI